MKTNIVNQQRGRLRLRLGRYQFTKEQGYGISTLLLSLPGVRQVIPCATNGSLLIFHDLGEEIGPILSALSQLRLRDLPAVDPTEEQKMQEEENQFQEKLSWLLARHWGKKLLPLPLRAAITCVQSISYLKEGVFALRQGKLSVEVLDATAIGATLVTGNFTSASSTMFLLNLSQLMLDYSNQRAKNQLAKSLAITTSQLWLVEGGQERQIPSDQLRVGDVIRLRTGSMVPVDGEIVAGDALVNQSTMTGEPLPVHKRPGATVFAGTLLEEGSLDIAVRTLGGDTRIAQIISFIDNGQEAKAQIQGQAERLADRIVPLSFGLFLATLAFSGNLARAMSVLMVDFSCAIKLTTPISVISALKEGAEEGFLVKGGKYLELLSQVDTIVFDKTGTLTEAVPKIAKIVSVQPDYDEMRILTIAACLEEHFPHSVAAAIVAEASQRGLVHPENHGSVEYVVAHGIVAQEEGARCIIGSKHFVFEDEGVPFPKDKEAWLQEEIGSHSPVYLAVEGQLVGVLCIYDPPRPEAREAVALLRQQGIQEILMFTGDGEETARHISQELGLDSFIASVLPDGKAKLVEELKSQGKTVLMVGDGINDAPALSCAHVSLTLAGSSDLAREVADISILSHDLRDIVQARQLALGLMEKISRHYGTIVGINTTLIGLGVLGLSTAAQNAWFHNMSTLGLAGLATGKILRQKPPAELN